MPCMGRLDHAKQSVPALMAFIGTNSFVFVDYYCPDHSGAWVSKKFPTAIVEDLSQQAPLTGQRRPVFNKPTACNSGALAAIQAGAEYLVFLDADTLVSPQLIAFILGNASRDRFMIFEPSLEQRDLTGFLVVHKSLFLKVGGFDREFQGWGAEDLEMRVKLLLRGGAPIDDPKAILRDPKKHLLRWTEIPAVLAQSIPHGDSRRVSHYENKDKDSSHGLNLNLLCANIYNWLGIHPVDLHDTPLGPYIRRLIGMELNVHHSSLE